MLHQFVMGHVDALANTASILPPIVMLCEFQMPVKLRALPELHATARASDESFALDDATSVWVDDFRLLLAFFLACHGIGSTDQALPIGLLVSGNAKDEASLVIVMATLEMDELRAALVVSVLADRADLSLVKVLDLVLELGLNLGQFAQLVLGQVFLYRSSLGSI